MPIQEVDPGPVEVASGVLVIAARSPFECQTREVASFFMPRLHAVYYRAPDGSELVSDFIDRLDAKRQVALANQIDRLNLLTPDRPHLPFPPQFTDRGRAP